MGLVLADRVQETTATTGTGTITLAGAVAQCQTFAAGVGTGNSTYYCLLSGDGTNWETGLGAVGGSGPYTLTRGAVISSSNSGSAISLTGTSTVFCDLPASKIRPAVGGGLWDLSAGVPPLSSFTQIGISGLTSLSTSGSSGTITIKDTGTNSITLHGVSHPVPGSTPYRVAALIAATGPIANFIAVQWGWTDGTKFSNAAFVANSSSSGGVEFTADTWTSSTSRASAGQISGSPPASITPAGLGVFWVGLRDDGTNVYYELSNDGVNFWTLLSTSKSSGYLGSSGYTNVFIGLNVQEAFAQTLAIRCYDPNGLTRAFP